MGYVLVTVALCALVVGDIVRGLERDMEGY